VRPTGLRIGIPILKGYLCFRQLFRLFKLRVLLNSCGTTLVSYTNAWFRRRPR
jgi:hypothetical protein